MSRRTWFRLVLLSGLLVGLGFALPGWTQAARGKRYALLVGVREYDSSALRGLEFTENDVVELAKELRKPSAGFTEVRVMTNSRSGKDRPTAANIRRTIRLRPSCRVTVTSDLPGPVSTIAKSST